MKPIQEDGPGRLKDFDKDVVVDIGDKVGHLMVRTVELVELSSQAGIKSPELLLILHCDAP